MDGRVIRVYSGCNVGVNYLANSFSYDLFQIIVFNHRSPEAGSLNTFGLTFRFDIIVICINVIILSSCKNKKERNAVIMLCHYINVLAICH